MPQPYIFQTETVIKCHYSEIEAIIDEQFKTKRHKGRFELPCIEERGSGSGETWEVNLRKGRLDKYYKSEIKEVFSGKWPSFCTRTLLQSLCNRGIIPEGTYMIDISW